MVEGLANMLLAKLMDLLILLFTDVQRPKRPLLPAKIFACQKDLFIVIYATRLARYNVFLSAVIYAGKK